MCSVSGDYDNATMVRLNHISVLVIFAAGKSENAKKKEREQVSERPIQRTDAEF